MNSLLNKANKRLNRIIYSRNTPPVAVGIIDGVLIRHFGLMDGILLGIGLFCLVMIIMNKLEDLKQN